MAPASPGEGGPAKSPLPDTLHVMATIAAASPEALARGEFRLLFDNGGGPSGARLLGRFCHARSGARPAGAGAPARRRGAQPPAPSLPRSSTCRRDGSATFWRAPVLREYEIPFLGRSGAASENQIPVSDLRVSVAGNRIVLRSARLGREVIPRLTSAHNFWRGSLGVYRFLCMLQSQGRHGRHELELGCPRRRRVPPPRHRRPAGAHPRLLVDDGGRDQAPWSRHRAPRATLPCSSGAKSAISPVSSPLVDADNELLVDLENVLSIDTFLDVVEERDRARLVEVFPGPDELAATGPEGRFLHEVLVS